MCEKWHVRKAISVWIGVRWQKAKRITTIGVVRFCVFVYGPQYSYTSSSSSLSSSSCYGGPVRETRDGCIEKGDFSTLVVVFFSTFVSSRVILSIRACKRAVAVSGNSLAELVPPLPECDAVATWSWPGLHPAKLYQRFHKIYQRRPPNFGMTSAVVELMA